MFYFFHFSPLSTHSLSPLHFPSILPTDSLLISSLQFFPRQSTLVPFDVALLPLTGHIRFLSLSFFPLALMFSFSFSFYTLRSFLSFSPCSFPSKAFSIISYSLIFPPLSEGYSFCWYLFPFVFVLFHFLRNSQKLFLSYFLILFQLIQGKIILSLLIFFFHLTDIFPSGNTSSFLV